MLFICLASKRDHVINLQTHAMLNFYYLFEGINKEKIFFFIKLRQNNSPLIGGVACFSLFHSLYFRVKKLTIFFFLFLIKIYSKNMIWLYMYATESHFYCKHLNFTHTLQQKYIYVGTHVQQNHPFMRKIFLKFSKKSLM